MNVRDNAWWISLAVFWIIFIGTALIDGATITAILGIGALAGLLASARVTALQRQRIRFLRERCAELEDLLLRNPRGR